MKKKESHDYSVLIVDDDSMDIVILTGILKNEYTIHAATDGADAIETAKGFLPDIILLDMLMPEMDGLEVLSTLKESMETKHIPVIFITSMNSEVYEEKAFALGATDYITKPFSNAIVKLRVKNQIQIVEQLRRSKHEAREMKRLIHENELQLAKMNLMTKATKIALWDMEVTKGNPVNPDNKFVWTDEFRQMLGFSDENDFPNVLNSWIDRLHPDDKNRAIEHFKSHILDNTGQTPFDIEYRLKRKSGKYAYYHACGETIRNDDGNPLRVVGSLMNITKTKNMVNGLQKLKLEADAANKAKSSFLSTVSHEIRTPLNAVIGISEIQLFNSDLDPEMKEAFEKIYSSGDMLLRIINDLLDFSKIEAGKFELIIDDYETASLLSDAAQLNIMRIANKPIEFLLEVDENIPAVLSGDELRVKQILNNILSNAFKYTREGKVILSVSASSHDDSDKTTLVFTVSDTGLGMTKEQVERLFDQYSRFNLKANRATEGTGLGMDITRSLINMMNGEILVESEPGKGSTFIVRLPQGKGATDSGVLGREIADNLSNFQISHKAYLKREKIIREPMPYGNVLIVDDVETNIYVTKGLMAQYKLKSDSAASGLEAIEKIKNGKKYDIIFMDHMMPEMDGVEATKIIRNMGYKHPIVALSANAVVGQADIFIENGFDDFVSKPIDLEQLDIVLKRLIRDKQPADVIEAALSQASDETSESKKSIHSILGMMDLRDKKIDGLDVEKILERYGYDEKMYLNTLRSYSASIRPMLESLGIINEDDLKKYETTVHGISGTSFTIFANEIGKKAKELEKAAIAGDLKYIKKHNAAFIKKAQKLIDDIDKMLKDIDSDNPKPKKDKPEDTVLSEMIAACEIYSMSGVNKAMEKIDSFQYESDDGLVDWLQENVKLMKFTEIAEKLSALIESIE